MRQLLTPCIEPSRIIIKKAARPFSAFSGMSMAAQGLNAEPPAVKKFPAGSLS
jgi:hypothetical protein